MNITNMFTIDRSNTRVAAVGYGRQPKLHFGFYDATSQAELFNLIGSMEYLGGARNTTA